MQWVLELCSEYCNNPQVMLGSHVQLCSTFCHVIPLAVYAVYNPVYLVTLTMLIEYGLFLRA